MYKMIISSGVVLIFQNFNILDCSRVKGQKKPKKAKKKLLLVINISGTIDHLIVIYGAHV